MIDFEISKEDLQRIARKMERLSPKERGRLLVDAFRRVSLMVERDLKANISGRYLKVRTGRLRASIGNRVDMTEEGLEGVIGSGVRSGERVKYADIHETGGTITARRAKYLTIPTEYALTRAGVTKRISARDFEDTFVRQGIIWQKQGKRKIVPLFILKKSVTIPARKYMSKTLEQDKDRILKMMLDTIRRALEQ